jgi:hypothetical protein
MGGCNHEKSTVERLRESNIKGIGGVGRVDN